MPNIRTSVNRVFALSQMAGVAAENPSSPDYAGRGFDVGNHITRVEDTLAWKSQGSPAKTQEPILANDPLNVKAKMDELIQGQRQFMKGF